MIKHFLTWLMPQQSERKATKLHYLDARLQRLNRLAKCAQDDKNTANFIRANQLKQRMFELMMERSKISLPYIN